MEKQTKGELWNKAINMKEQTKEQELEKEIKERETLCIGEQKEDGRWNYTDTLKAELKGIQEGRTQALAEVMKIINEAIEGANYNQEINKGIIWMQVAVSLQNLRAVIDKTAQEIKT
jgi:cell division ATPase FtsA